MIRVFVSMSQTLNLSKTCREMGQTRQTVRRHLTDLEEILGHSLFEVTERQYVLTDFGKNNLASASRLLSGIDAWSGQSQNQTLITNGLEENRFTDECGREYFSQQHSVSKIGEYSSPLITQALSAWAMSQAKIDHKSWANIRPYSVLYRKSLLGWVFVEVGERSAYSRWFGSDWAKSAAGKLMNEDDVGDDFNNFISGAYARIYDEGGVRLDHLYVHTQKDDGEIAPATFQRLLVGGIFPDGTPALSVIAVITRNVRIDALTETHHVSMSEEYLMDETVAESQ